MMVSTMQSMLRVALRSGLPLVLCVGVLPAQQSTTPEVLGLGQAQAGAPMMMQVFTTGGSFLGVAGKDVTPESAKALKLKEEYGVELTTVEAESAAEKAGLKVGDVILEYNGQRIEGFQQLQRMVSETPVGRTVKLLVLRDGKTQSMTAVLGQRKAKVLTLPGEGRTITIPPSGSLSSWMPDIPSAMMSWRSPVLGVIAESLEPQLAAYFGVKEGVLIRSVNSGSAAEKAGLKAGDVILKVDETKVSSPREITSAIRDAKKKSVAVAIMRDRKESTITVSLPEEAERKVVPRGTQIRQIQ